MPRSDILPAPGIAELILTRAAVPERVRAILLDIEGTTTPIDFVYGTLFPFARARISDFVRRHLDRGDVREDIKALRQEHAREAPGTPGLPAWPAGSAEADADAAVAYILWLMDGDRKSTPLKSLQGKIWEAGYRSGELRGAVYPDVAPAFRRWRAQGRTIAIFSSGSVLAQKLLFGHSTVGDLALYIGSYFDTTTGPKQEAQSYQRIAAVLGLPAAEIVFLSDVIAELDAARRAGAATLLCLRPGHPAASTAGGSHPAIHTFDELFP